MKAKIGSISQGTMRPQDLIPRFLDVLKNLEGTDDLTTAITSRIEFADDDSNCYDYYASDAAEFDLQELFDALENYTPDGCYFGANPGDGADYGFWPIEGLY